MDIDPYTGKNKGIYNLNFIAREKNPNLRTVVSFGGWSGSVHFSNVAKSSSARANFVSKAIAFVNKFHFDGIDIDWEYPGGGGLPCNTVDPNDAINFETLLGDLRSALGPNRILSIASAGASFRYNVGSKNYVSSYMKHLSYLQIMSYDFYGSWVPYTDFNAPLNEDPSQPKANLQNNQVFSIANAFKDFVGQGVSPSQLVVGLAFYGRSWIASAKGSNNGLYQLCGNLANGQKQDPSKPKACPAPPGDQLDADWTDPCGATYKSGVWMYLNLRKQGVLSGPTTAGSGYTRQYHDFAQSPSLYETSTGRFISYDDPQSLQAKAAWAKAQGAGGVMFWELSEDYQRELLNAVQAGWGH
ncbi:glycoside hydrolase [Polychytrium aggregatum]|uniref:glycoside hydrolase n=1 Tax=Polychytrium aggregatum TaxID=110093 RepID=UPI0022FE0CCD|nr:glycoside hydrolase [Polychytrium aggregatum]KAI9190597.1 glycoside hydrolase [Polychytrium aggregatum]